MPTFSTRTAPRITPRTCFLHVGTHKTGTTSLQNAFAANDGLLRAAGVHFPAAGRWRGDGGHHNVAWELNADERFERHRGTLDDVLAEALRVRAPAVTLSSEDFEYLHAKPEPLRRVVDGFATIGYRTAIVLYLRPQSSYAESLYAELVKHRYTRTFEDFLESVLRDGQVTHGPKWRFTFDYDTLTSDLAAIVGEERMIVRPYDTLGTSLVRDFLRLVCPEPAALDMRPFRRVARLNSSARFNAVVQKFYDNLGRRDRCSSTRIRAGRAFRSRFDPVRLPEVERIGARFAAGNQRVFERYGAAIPYVSRLHLFGDVAAALGFDYGSEARRALLREQRTAAAS